MYRNLVDSYFISPHHILILFKEYEAEMRSYQIAVKDFFIEDPPDLGDVFLPTPVPILTKKVQFLSRIYVTA